MHNMNDSMAKRISEWRTMILLEQTVVFFRWRVSIYIHMNKIIDLVPEYVWIRIYNKFLYTACVIYCI